MIAYLDTSALDKFLTKIYFGVIMKKMKNIFID